MIDVRRHEGLSYHFWKLAPHSAKMASREASRLDIQPQPPSGSSTIILLSVLWTIASYENKDLGIIWLLNVS